MITNVKILVSKNIFVENVFATTSLTHPCSIYYCTTFTSEYIRIKGITWVQNVCHWRRSGVFIVNFEHISHLVKVFLLLTLNM